MRCRGSSGHRAVLDGVEGLRLLEAALQPLHERALAGAHRTHEVEDLPALLTLQRRRVEVAYDLRDRLLDAEELVAEEVEDLEVLVLVEPLDARIVGVVDVLGAHPHQGVVQAGVRETGNAGVFADQVEVFEEAPAPHFRLARRAVFFDQLLEGGPVHRTTLLFLALRQGP
jgi:hypothetical protein